MLDANRREIHTAVAGPHASVLGNHLRPPSNYQRVNCRTERYLSETATTAIVATIHNVVTIEIVTATILVCQGYTTKRFDDATKSFSTSTK